MLLHRLALFGLLAAVFCHFARVDAEEAAPPAAADEVPAAAGDAPAAALTTISTAPYLADLQARHAGKVAILGKGAFRFVSVGDAKIPDPDKLLALTEQVTKGLELWSGNQNLFTPPADADGTCHLIIFKSKGDFDGFVDFLRKERGLQKPDGEDLTKKLNSLWLPRAFATVEEKFLPPAFPAMAEHFTVNLAAGILIKTYFQQRGEIIPPPWLIEGMRSDMEILLTKAKTPRITTIAYEMNNDKEPPPNNWLQAMSQLLAKPNDKIRRASDVLLIELIQSSRSDYIQMWSLNLFLRQVGAGKGEKNKFAHLLAELAAGTESRTAITKVYGIDDPQLTRKWHEWAGRGKR